MVRQQRGGRGDEQGGPAPEHEARRHRRTDMHAPEQLPKRGTAEVEVGQAGSERLASQERLTQIEATGPG